MTLKVSVPLTHFFCGPLVPLPTPWQSLLSSLEYDVLHTYLYFGWRRSYKYSRDSPVLLSNTSIYVCSSDLGVYHKLMSSEGYFLCAASTAWILKDWWVVQYWVLWVIVWFVAVSGSNWFGADWESSRWEIVWWLAGIFLVEMGRTCEGTCCTRRCTLGAGGITGVAIGTLGYRWFYVDSVQYSRSVVAVSAAVSPAWCSMVSWRSLMAWSCASTVDAGVSLSAAVSCCNTYSTLFYGVTDGSVSLWCLNLMV